MPQDLHELALTQDLSSVAQVQQQHFICKAQDIGSIRVLPKTESIFGNFGWINPEESGYDLLMMFLRTTYT